MARSKLVCYPVLVIIVRMQRCNVDDSVTLFSKLFCVIQYQFVG